jgi:uncharacterized protein YigA (DUF484 family)
VTSSNKEKKKRKKKSTRVLSVLQLSSDSVDVVDLGSIMLARVRQFQSRSREKLEARRNGCVGELFFDNLLEASKVNNEYKW